VLSERQVSARFSGRDVLGEAGLAPEAGAELHSRRLRAFRVTDVGCHIHNIASAIERHKQDTVVISHHEVVGGDDVVPAGGGRESKRVLWLNPELPGAWGFGDSAMRDYEPHVTRAVVAYNLESLRKVVDELVL